MDTKGFVSFAPYIHGVKQINGTTPGYRAEFLAEVDFYQFRNMTLLGQISNMTMISRTAETPVLLDKIRYNLSPGIRLDRGKFLITCQFNHESIYALSRAEELKGAFWKNSIRLIFQTKGASFLFIRDEYKGVNNEFLNSWDAVLGVGHFLHGSTSIWVAKNHNYRQELFSSVRYHLGVFNHFANFYGAQYQLWNGVNGTVEQKIVMAVNLYQSRVDSFWGLFYRYVIHDSGTQDNEHHLGKLGLRILF